MDIHEVPLTFKGEQVGVARLTTDDEGIHISGEIFDAETAAAILGPGVSNVSYGFDPDGVSFSAVQPGENALIHKENR